MSLIKLGKLNCMHMYIPIILFLNLLRVQHLSALVSESSNDFSKFETAAVNQVASETGFKSTPHFY